MGNVVFNLYARWSGIKDEEKARQEIIMNLPPHRLPDVPFLILPIHEVPKLIPSTIDLLNSQWPVSEKERLDSLKSSCDYMPCCLVMTVDLMSHVIAHCKIIPMLFNSDACFLQNFIVDKAYRGKGVGTILMKFVENYCRVVLDLEEIYLDTADQCGFYERLGFTKCEPLCYDVYAPDSDKQFMMKVIKK